jgi:hypothetical protein
MKNPFIISGLILLAFIIHSCKKDNTPIIPTQGLVAYYPFNGNANDASGNNLNGTVYGATLTTDRNGTPNKAYYFNGIDSYIKVLANQLFNTPAYTVAVWVNVEKFGGSVSHGGFIISKGVDPNYYYNLNANNTNRFHACTISSGDYIQFQSTITFNTNTWYLLVITDDGSNFKITFDAVVNDVLSVGSTQTNNNDIYIGRYERNTNWNFKGIIDDIRIYNRALSETEIQQLYYE